jgi:hypothetical protein
VCCFWNAGKAQNFCFTVIASSNCISKHCMLFSNMVFYRMFSVWHTLICYFVSQEGGLKLYVAVNMCLHVKPCPLGMQAYEDKTC